MQGANGGRAGSAVAPLPPALEQKLKRQLQEWRQDLLNLSRRNRALYFKHTKSASFEVVAPGVADLWSRVGESGSKGLTLHIPSERAEVDDGVPQRPPRWEDWVSQLRVTEFLTDKTDPKAIERGAAGLSRKATTEFLDRGIWTLYLGLGFLRWVDADDGASVDSPLLLVPVELSQREDRTAWQLRRSEDDVVVNPSLAMKLEVDYSISLPALDDLEVVTPASVLEATGQVVGGRDGWSVAERAVVTTFSFHKEAMYRDLLDNEAAILSHPMIRMLGLGPDNPGSDELAFDYVPDEELDTKAPPEQLMSILDADASQRRCVVAGRDGHSFVMDGPPGTGKSQTIANLIAELIGNGRTVLFVSEKAAALDVVHNRLQSRGLGPFVLELHSHKATRREVAMILGEALGQRPRATEDFRDHDRNAAADRRMQLSSYAEALNEPRHPFGRSLLTVLGLILDLGDAPVLPLPQVISTDLTSERYQHILDTAKRLGNNWGPVERGDDFLWRDMAVTEMSAAERGRLERLLHDAQEAASALTDAAQSAGGELGLPWHRSESAVRRLARLLTLAETGPVVPDAWLTGPDLDPIFQLATELRKRCQAHDAALDAVGRTAPGATPLPSASNDAFRRAVVGARAVRPALTVPDTWAPADVAGAQQTLRWLASTVGQVKADSEWLAGRFGFARMPTTLSRAGDVAEVATIVGTPTPPDPTWLNPVLQQQLAAAAASLAVIVGDYRNRQAALAEVFTPAVLQVDLVALRQRFGEVHKGLRRLSGGYRGDKRTLAACTVAGKFDRALLPRLDEAIAWQQTTQQLEQTERAHAPVLGANYYRRDQTDFDRINAALEVTGKVLALVGQDLNQGALSSQLALGAQADPNIPTVAQRLKSNLTDLERSGRPAAQALGVDLTGMTMSEISEWATQALDALGSLEAAMQAIATHVGTGKALGACERLVSASEQVHSCAQAVEVRTGAATDLLGDHFAGLDTNWDAVTAAIDWAHDVRRAHGGPLPAVTVRALAARRSAAEVVVPLERWEKLRATVADQFLGQTRAQIEADLQANFDDAVELLGALAETIDDAEEWTVHRAARQELIDQGFAEQVAELESLAPSGSQVQRAISRCVYDQWADTVIRSDPRLEPTRALDRDELLNSFRQLDQGMITGAAARVINECAARRPSSIKGAAQHIKRQAELKRRHKPIRTLLGEAGAVAQQLKPCFMMSPLSVSQYLPPELTFDVVIFDEASQVRPSDAVNCIYRGRQMIVAGDQKQLPPTNFFEAQLASDDELDDDALDPFDSVLDLAKGSGGLPSLPLNWHYRSRHEALISYSNQRFYDGGLWTFPGSVQDAPDVGIGFFKVDGIYRRGTTSDNPIEADAVVDRVLFHTRQHPDRSLGVVTFSSAQESAVVAAIERRAEEEPELRNLATDDRLNGFFVKNLENVQGDERDILIFSIGYGRDEHGKLTMNFGPLNREGGWRRLNVAITRARQRIEIVSSIRATDFTPHDNEGVLHLKGYLDYAERGTETLARDLHDSQGDTESVFEQQVLRAVTAMGYNVVSQVGEAGYRIDLAVRHPDRPGEYVLGIECDGAMYHSSRVARDRDRLRQQVLEGLGWRIYRIWGISWFRDRQRQEERLREEIRAAIEGRPTAQPVVVNEPHEAPKVKLQQVDLEAAPEWVVPYTLASPRRPRTSAAIHLPEARAELRQLIFDVVKVEAPVNHERVLRAVRTAWGVRRTGHRVRQAFDEAVAQSHVTIRQDPDGFLSLVGADEEPDTIRVRKPTAHPETERPIAEVAPIELQAAIVRLVADAHAIEQADLTTAVARIFGWTRKGADIQAVLDRQVEALERSGRLRRQGTSILAGGA